MTIHIHYVIMNTSNKGPCPAVGSFRGECQRIFPTKEVARMNQIIELLMQLVEELKRLNDLIEKIEYIAVKRTKK